MPPFSAKSHKALPRMVSISLLPRYRYWYYTTAQSPLLCIPLVELFFHEPSFHLPFSTPPTSFVLYPLLPPECSCALPLAPRSYRILLPHRAIDWYLWQPPKHKLKRCKIRDG